MTLTANIQETVKPVQFFSVRDNRKLVNQNLQPLVDAGEELQTLFAETDLDIVAEKYINGWNKIINSIAPLKRIQIKKSHDDLISRETKKLKEKHDEILDYAISNKNQDSFREARTIQNRITKKLEEDKKDILKIILKTEIYKIHGGQRN